MHLTIGGATYHIELARGPIDDGRGRLCDGLTLPGPCEIKINAMLPPSKRWKVALHEIVHAMKVELDPAEQPHLDEETLCNLISTGLCSITLEQFSALHAFVTGQVEGD